MKNNVIKFIIMFCLMLFACCGTELPDSLNEYTVSKGSDTDQITVSKDLKVTVQSLSFEAAGGIEGFTIISNTTWTIACNQSWCTVSSSSESGSRAITVYVSENTSPSSRSATITVKADSLSQNIGITQDGASQENQSARTFTVNGVWFRMIRVDGGTFTMGATSEQGSDAYDNEKPVHSVTLSTYYIGETEVTQDLWQVVMGKNPSLSNIDGLRKAVENVRWYDCQDFISKLNSLTGQNFRLPTEAEWEFAARGGNNSRGYKYAGSNTIGDVAWYSGNSHGMNPDVAKKSPNELGLYDMSGNVSEWCQDWYGDYSSSSQTNPIGSSAGSLRVIRGGSRGESERGCRVSFRSLESPKLSNSALGLRLALQ